MAKAIEIIKGNSYAYSVDRKLNKVAVDLTDYTLEIRVLTDNGLSTGISRFVTTLNNDSTAFLVNLTATETDTLKENKTYKLCNRLVSAADEYVRDIEETITIQSSCFD